MKTKDSKKTARQKESKGLRLSTRLSITLGLLGFLIILGLSYFIVDLGSQSTKKNLDKNMDDLLT